MPRRTMGQDDDHIKSSRQPGKALMPRHKSLRGAGNTPLEVFIAVCDRMGIETGVDLEAVTRTSWWLFGTLGRRPNSRVAQALGAKLGLAA